MASWKKVVVSGSNANLANVQVDTLTSGNVVIGGGSGSFLSTTPINGTGNILATTNASGVTMTGSFSGSFTGGLTSTLANVVYPNLVTYNTATGQFAYASTSSLIPATASYAISSSYAISASTAVSSSYATSASAAVQAASATSASYALSSSYAATSSYANTFIVGGTLTAQTLIVQTITSSVEYSSGSNIFGSAIGNTQQLIGTTTVSGSLAVNGSPVILTNQTSSMSASYAVSASQATTASYVTPLNQSVIVSGGVTHNGAYTGAYVDGLVIDYATGMGRLSVGPADGFTFYNNGPASSSLATISTTGVMWAAGGFSGSFAGTASYANNANTASYAFNAGQLTNALTAGLGLVTTTYNGSAAVTFNVSGASALTTNTLTKWGGFGFLNTNISDSGNQVTIGSGATSGLTVQAGGINVTGNSTFVNDVTVGGNFTVNGTTTFINTANLYIKDQFVEIASGSASLVDAGIVSQYNTAGSGSAFYLSSNSTGTYGRWAVAYDVLGTQTSVAANEYVVSAKIGQAAAPGAATPTWGGATNGTGNIWVTTSGDIYIYS